VTIHSPARAIEPKNFAKSRGASALKIMSSPKADCRAASAVRGNNVVLVPGQRGLHVASATSGARRRRAASPRARGSTRARSAGRGSPWRDPVVAVTDQILQPVALVGELGQAGPRARVARLRHRVPRSRPRSRWVVTDRDSASTVSLAMLCMCRRRCAGRRRRAVPALHLRQRASRS